MRWCLVITLAVVCLNAATARPSDGVEWQAAGLQAWPYVAAYPTYPIQQANAQLLLDPYYNAPTNLVPIAYNGLPVYQAPVQLVSGQVNAAPTTQKKTMAKATAEPTTPPPAQRPAVLRSGSDKLRNAATQTPKNIAGTASQSTVMDLQYLRAVQQPNTQFVVEKIIPVPGTRLYESPPLEAANQRTALPATARPNLAVQKKSNAKQTFDQNSEEDDSQVVVSATGHTATGQPIPEIPIGTFFSPYFGLLGQPDPNQKQASLILEPHAKSIVGNGGTAIATPVSHAILKKGVPARVLFRPQAVAVAGVGGTAHAQADLILDYVDRKHRSDDEEEEVVLLPYYGGAKGQTLEIVHRKDGTVTSSIIRNDDTTHVRRQKDFDSNLQSIQKAAARLVAIQEGAKKRGTFSEVDSKIYADNLGDLGKAAQELARMQDSDGNSFRKLFESINNKAVKQKIRTAAQKLELTKNPYDNPDEVEEEHNTFLQDDSDTVAINAPDKESAVAEAKPVGLSIAGEGGVASSKPVATAVAGKDGLAIARPVATAIAGISPAEVAELGLAIPNKIKRKNQRTSISSDPAKVKFRPSAAAIAARGSTQIDERSAFSESINSDVYDDVYTLPESPKNVQAKSSGDQIETRSDADDVSQEENESAGVLRYNYPSVLQHAIYPADTLSIPPQYFSGVTFDNFKAIPFITEPVVASSQQRAVAHPGVYYV